MYDIMLGMLLKCKAILCRANFKDNSSAFLITKPTIQKIGAAIWSYAFNVKVIGLYT